LKGNAKNFMPETRNVNKILNCSIPDFSRTGFPAVMGFINEAKEVDFIIQSEPLTDKERQEINKYIAESKEKKKK
jgi:hypothetical protein